MGHLSLAALLLLCLAQTAVGEDGTGQSNPARSRVQSNHPLVREAAKEAIKIITKNHHDKRLKKGGESEDAVTHWRRD